MKTLAAVLLLLGTPVLSAAEVVVGTGTSPIRCVSVRGGALELDSCRDDGSQRFRWAGYGPLAQGDRCVTSGDGDRGRSALALARCDGSAPQTWAWDDVSGKLSDVAGWCVSVEAGRTASAVRCSTATREQSWRRGTVVPLDRVSADASTHKRLSEASVGDVIETERETIVVAGRGKAIVFPRTA